MLSAFKFGRVVLLVAVASGATAATSTMAAAEKLMLGNEGTNPPFSIKGSDGTLAGMEPDLAREMCARMKDDCTFDIMGFRALIPSLLQGKFDLLVGNLSPTPERKEKLLFTRPIVANPVTFVAPADSDFEYTHDGLMGKGVRLGMLRGGAHSDFVKEKLGDAVEYSYYDNSDQQLLDLKAGRINMLFMPKISAIVQLIDKPEGKDWKLAGGEYYIGQEDLPLEQRGNSWVMRKDQPDLLTKVNAALDSMVADCTYTKIRKRYISLPTLPGDEACVAKDK